MSASFSINFNWLSKDYGDVIDRATFAEVVIAADGCIGTELDDLLAKTVRTGTRVSTYTLAQWLLANWWRLRWEPIRSSASWRMSHKLGAAGGGYYWPDISFIGDGEAILVHARATSPGANKLVRYLNSFDVAVPASDFEQAIDLFVEAVISRLVSARLTGEQVDANNLITLWKELSEERHDPALTRWRKLEAILGCDPDEASEELIEGLEASQNDFGTAAIEEIAAASMQNALDDIRTLWGAPYRNSTAIQIPGADEIQRRVFNEVRASTYAWQRAVDAARIARQVWSISEGPVSNKVLSDVFNIAPATIDDGGEIRAPMSAGFRNGDADGIRVFFNSPFHTNRRFALMRVVGDRLVASPDDRLFPVAASYTQRQKFQRAFAQEFLCPYSELTNYLGSSDINDDDVIAKAAHHYDVSTKLIETTLVNKKRLDRSVLEI